LSEEIKVDAVNANLSDGILEVILSKKAPKSLQKLALEFAKSTSLIFMLN
jgi:HSP20 family molecular chaperone IbpA